jgi:hypothetical protein
MPIIVPSGRDNENPTLTLDDVFGGPLSDLSELPDSPQSDSDEDVSLFPRKRRIGRDLTDWFGDFRYCFETSQKTASCIRVRARARIRIYIHPPFEEGQTKVSGREVRYIVDGCQASTNGDK